VLLAVGATEDDKAGMAVFVVVALFTGDGRIPGVCVGGVCGDGRTDVG
jgi:hypothetical protein